MSNSSICKSSVYKAYQDVINDVILNAREHFIEDGVDEAVLQELKQLWETKLAATKAVDENRDADKVISPNNKPKPEYINQHYIKPLPATVHQLQLQHQQQQQQHQQQQQQQQQQQLLLNNKQIVGQVPPNNHMPQGPPGIGLPEWRRVPIQINIPSPGSADGHRILSIDVPEVFLQGHHLRSILTGQAISTTMSLPLATACAYLQDHVNAAFIEHQQSYYNSLSNGNPQMHNHMHDRLLENRLRGIPQGDGPADYSYASLTNSSTNPPSQKSNNKRSKGNNSDPVLNSSFPNDLEDQLLLNSLRGIPQGDGPADSSDDDDKSDEGSEEIEDDKEEDEMEDDLTGEAEDEPLNSGDDVSDADGTEESFETENVIVCQYDKITRSRNRWKFHLKDGIMNLKGEDFIFQKANGDAEW
ncbi:transcription initiation factor IIA subunit 1-like isoform X1 [Diabrotica virgifera virgifera]|uniref:Transcription initiation factor IIA subunit 1 n=2 Tax=Diabrotica virgifera virgifera TaxID=50390 RepID=A0ABM5LA64_DIAVI|nr:transcription initiation factor IIA subunit 1-like isoform X1 [Diabrotica virgifera virgifera]